MIEKGIEEINDYINGADARMLNLSNEVWNTTDPIEKDILKRQIRALLSYKSGLEAALKILGGLKWL